MPTLKRVENLKGIQPFVFTNVRLPRWRTLQRPVSIFQKAYVTARSERMAACRYRAFRRRLSATSNILLKKSISQSVAKFSSNSFALLAILIQMFTPWVSIVSSRRNKIQMADFFNRISNKADILTTGRISPFCQSARVDPQSPCEHRTDFLIARAGLSRLHLSI